MPKQNCSGFSQIFGRKKLLEYGIFCASLIITVDIYLTTKHLSYVTPKFVAILLYPTISCQGKKYTSYLYSWLITMYYSSNDDLIPPFHENIKYACIIKMCFYDFIQYFEIVSV